MLLRPARIDDAAALAMLGRNSFCAAFAHLYRPDDLAAFLGEVYSRDVVAAEIADPATTHQLADDAGALAAYIKLRTPSSYAEHSDTANPIALGQLYTDPERTGEGLGAMLMDWALNLACANGHDAVQLSVWSENTGAQRFYQRYGFAKIADIHFWVGTHRDDEFLYELRL